MKGPSKPIAWKAAFSVFIALALLASCLPCVSAQTQSAHQCCPHHEKSSQPNSHDTTSQSDCALGSVDTVSLERPHTGLILATASAEFVVLPQTAEVSAIVAPVVIDASPGEPVLPLVLRV